MVNPKRKEIYKTLGQAKWLLLAGGLVILFMPFILTLPAFNSSFNNTATGQIGDTIGGTTAPFLNLIGSILVFFALKAQVKANDLIQDQIDNDVIVKESENETNNLNQLYSYLNQGINNFHFTTLPLQFLKNKDQIETEIEFEGGDAFYHLFSQIRCHYHGSQEDLNRNQSVSELVSILSIMELLLDKLENSIGQNREIIKTLVKHQFYYKIITKIRDESTDDLKVIYCKDCDCNHGLPDELRDLIERIRTKLG